MSILAQVSTPDAEQAAESVSASERWEKFIEFWKGIEWENLGKDLWQHVQTPAFWIDIGMVIVCVLIAAAISWQLRRREFLINSGLIKLARSRIAASRKFPFFFGIFALVLWLAVFVAGLLEFTCPVLRAVTIIYTAYVALNLPSLMARRPFWVKPLITIIIVATVLYMFGLLDDVVDQLDAWAIQLGDTRISALSILIGPLVFLLAWGIGRVFTGLAERRIASSPNVPPTVQVLIGKMLSFVLFVVVIGITLSAVGINLTTLTVFGGALGLGIGFGLQKVISNLVSGVIILLDRSIKPGDVIEIGDTWGVINGLQTRYVSVLTRDKKEYLIPNEDFITQPVINWSFSDKLVRFRVPIGVSYDCDIREAIRLAQEAAGGHERICKDPAPRCLMRGFGDSAIDLELRFWVLDPGEGRGNIISAVLLSVWDAYRENDIEIPFPQRDVHLRSGGEVLRDTVSPDQPDPD